MPTLKVIAAEPAAPEPRKEVVPNNNSDDDQQHSTSLSGTTAATQQQRKITPVTDKKNESQQQQQTKTKQQRTLVSFFSGAGAKRKAVSTPSAVPNNKKQAVTKKQPAAKKEQSNSSSTDKNCGKTANGASQQQESSTQAATVQSKSASTSAKASTTKTTADKKVSGKASASHDIENLKEIVLGRRLAGHIKATTAANRDEATGDEATFASDDDSHSLLPRIPAPKISKRPKTSKSTAVGEKQPVEHESDESTTDNTNSSNTKRMGGLRSQLVHKFESLPAEEESTANDGNVAEEESAEDRAPEQAKESPTTQIETTNKNDEAKEILNDKTNEASMGSEDEENSENPEEQSTEMEGCEDEALQDASSDQDIIVDASATPGSKSEVKENDNTLKETPVANNTSTKEQGGSGGGLMSFLKPKSELSPAKSNAASTNPVATGKENSDSPGKKDVKMTDASPAVAEAKSSVNVTGETSSELEKEAPPQLSPECQALYEKHEQMRTKYCIAADKLVKQGSGGFDEEKFSIAMPSTDDICDLSADTEFPDAAVSHLTSLVEGSKLSLSELTKTACEALNNAFAESSFSEECVSGKIKVLAERKAYVKNPSIGAGTSVSNNVSAATDLFEDTNPDHVWRWEVAVLDLLPEESVVLVKKARSARKKLSLIFNATARLLAALDESIKLMSKGTPPKAKLEKVVAKISKEEEKVLKHERDNEKARLAVEAKKRKQETSKQKKDEEKERLKEEKKRQAEDKKREKEEAKQKKVLEREEAKRQKEEKEQAEKAKKDREQEEQRKRMLSFFGGGGGGGAAKKAKTEKSTVSAAEPSKAEPKDSHVKTNGFDAEHFQSCIDSGEVGKPLLDSLSRRALASRKRKSKRVTMTVFVSGANDDNPFAAQPVFAEEKEIEVRNRYKYLSFSEDLRPPYHGTWSKASAAKNLGRNPFSKEPALDYDVDSEAEWEEGDDDPGEDVDNDAGDEEEDKDEEGDTRMYNYQDGWLAEDDELDDDDELDEESKKLLKSRKRAEGSGFVPVCIIAPASGGVPVPDRYGNSSDPAANGMVEGFSVEQAFKLAAAHDGTTLVECDIFLDAFPPALVDEKDGTAEPSSTNAQTNEPSTEDMKTIARFVHHSNLASKDQVVEELRTAHSSVLASRAQGKRILDSIAEKKRNTKVKNGIYWEVKQDVLDNLGLKDLKAMKVPVEEEPTEKKVAAKKKPEAKKTGKAKSDKSKTEPGSASKAKKPVVSAASAKLFANFLNKK